MSAVSLILGIISILGALLLRQASFLTLPISIIGLVLATKVNKQINKKCAGYVVNIIGIILAIVLTVMALVVALVLPMPMTPRVKPLEIDEPAIGRLEETPSISSVEELPPLVKEI